jgi:hypothetical protein
MDYITLVLDLHALQMLMQGKDVAFHSEDDSESPIIVTCDINTTDAVKLAINLAMLNNIPPAPGVH